MSDNKNLHKAKSAKNDEFYTRYEDIEKEVAKYPKDLFKGKSIYCPCDDYRWSNFYRYFKENFEFLGLRCLTATNYDIGNGAYLCIYDGNTETVTGLRGNGDFCSEECTEIMRQCDMVITNPPFSLFRRFVAQLVGCGKDFLIVGNLNAVTYKEIFPLIRDNLMRLGYNSPQKFVMPETYQGEDRDENGNKIGKLCNARWFTTLPTVKPLTAYTIIGWSRHNDKNMDGSVWLGGKNDATINGKETYRRILIQNSKPRKGLPSYYQDPERYPKYDNYNAIEVRRTCDIPVDFEGIMGVPITFLDKYCPQQFEIIDLAKRGADFMKLRTKFYRQDEYENYSDLNAAPTLYENGRLKNTYARILIHHKHPISYNNN